METGAISTASPAMFRVLKGKLATPSSGMLEGIKKATTSDSRFTWVDADFLAAQKVRAWSDMPVWVPPRGDSAGFSEISISKALAKGLTFRAIPDTVKATLEWFRKQPEARRAKLKAGLTPEREAEVLAAWHAQKK